MLRRSVVLRQIDFNVAVDTGDGSIDLVWTRRFAVSRSSFNGKKGKGRHSSSWEPHLRATARHLPYGITQCYLPPDTSERAPSNPSHAGWYSIYLPRRDGRLS